MSPADISKAAFNVENGHYEYFKMPFKLKNAPVTLEKVMDNLLRELYNEFSFVYIDDIIITSGSFQDYLVHLTKVFQRLGEANISINLSY